MINDLWCEDEIQIIVVNKIIIIYNNSMSDYYLSDIHFHTNLSYDAYENNHKNKFDIDSFEKVDKNNNQVKLIIKTDHNIFNYKKYCVYKEQFSKYDVVFMPGIEMNAENKIHWLFYFDDEELNEKDGEKTKGDTLDEIVKSVFDYSSLYPDLSEIREKAHNNHKVINLIEKLNNNNISFLAVPHLNKTHGLYDVIKKENDKEILELVKYYLNEGIINGFESKHYDTFFSEHINKTIKHIEILEKEYKRGKQENKEGIRRRLDYLNKMTTLNSCINRNGVACIYGSDYHGESNDKYEEYQNSKEKLFYIKSQRTYEGLRLALLDQDSRVYTDKKYHDLRKEESNIIDKVILDINGTETILQFGDGLNSIIGSRGSGKSFLVNLMLNKGNYIGSNIYQQVKINKIIMSDSSELPNIDLNKCDYLQQKNSQENKESIYEFLSEAPYNVESFGNYIKKLDSVKEIKKEKKIKESIKIINNQINDEMKLVEIVEKGIDISFFNNYVKTNESKDDDMVVYNLFNNFVTDCRNMITIKEKSVALIDSFLESIDVNIDKLTKLLENEDFSKSLKDEDSNTIEVYADNILKVKDIASDSKEIINSSINSIKKVLLRSNNILNFVKLDLSNARLLYENNFRNISEVIKNMKELIHRIKEREETVYKIINSPIFNTEEYGFNINNNECTMDVSTSLDLQNLSEDEKKLLIRNYKKEITLKDFFDCIQNYEKYDNLKKIYDCKDGRFEDYSIQFDGNIKLNSIFEISTSLDGPRRNLSNMSPGERSSLLLDLLLNSNNMKPLIIDQPEDDLDNETVYNVILKKIRELKTRRQIIIITHNANLCINGDSDSIILCKNDNGTFNYISDCMESKELYPYSSSNNIKTYLRMLDIAVGVLDGGKDALRKKMKIIGQNDLLFKEDNNE